MKLVISLKSTFIRDVFSLSGGTAFAQVIAILTLPILTRLYTPEEFGIYALFITAASVLMILASLKLEQAVMLAKTTNAAVRIVIVLFISSLAVSVIIFALIFSASDWIFNWIDKSYPKNLLYLLPLSVFLLSNYQGLRFLQLRSKKFTLVAVSLISAVTISSIVSIVIGLWWKQILPMSYGLIIAYILESFIKIFVLALGIKWSLFSRISIREIKNIFIEYKGLISTLLVSHGIAAVSSALPVIAINWLFGASVLGYYSMAEKIISAPTSLISNAFGDVFRQRASERWREKKEFLARYLSTLKLTSMIGVPLYTIGILVAPTVFVLLFGEEWFVSGEMASILLIGGMFSFITVPVDKWAIITSAYKFIFIWQVFRLLLSFFVILITWYFSLNIEGFIGLLVIINILMYLIHAYNGYYASKGDYKNNA